MHWGQIKTLLILSFFILDIYLLAQFMEKKELSDIAVWEQQDSSIEEQLEAESITFQDLPEKEYEESFISVKQRYFTEKEITAYKDNVEQKPFIFNKDLIVSKLEEPIEIKDSNSNTGAQLTEMLNNIAFFPEEYTYWNWNKELNVIIFFQNKMDRPVYYNQNGLVLLFVNDENEITYYTQTMLGEAEALAERQKLIKPMRAIETLYGANELYSGDNISNVNIGFHTRVPFESGVQVFAPIWKVNVNNEKDYFVNAIEGFIFSTKEQEFLHEVINGTIDRMQIIGEKDSQITEILNDLKEREEELTSDGVSQ